MARKKSGIRRCILYVIKTICISVNALEQGMISRTIPYRTPASSKASTKLSVSGTVNGHDYVNLGLPSCTLSATCNVGANEPWNYSNY